MEFRQYDFGNDLRSTLEIKIWDEGKYLRLIVPALNYDKASTVHYEIVDDELINRNTRRSH